MYEKFYRGQVLCDRILEPTKKKTTGLWKYGGSDFSFDFSRDDPDSRIAGEYCGLFFIKRYRRSRYDEIATFAYITPPVLLLEKCNQTYFQCVSNESFVISNYA